MRNMFSLLLIFSCSGCASMGCDWMMPGSRAYHDKCIAPAVATFSEESRDRATEDEKRLCAKYGWCGQHKTGPVIDIYDSNGSKIGTAFEE